MIEIELNDLKKVGKELSEELGQRLKGEVTQKGHSLYVPDAANGHKIGMKDVKLQLKHVLHHMGLLDDYRVLVEHQKVRIVKIEERVRHVGRAGAAPPPSQSLPYFFPG